MAKAAALGMRRAPCARRALVRAAASCPPPPATPRAAANWALPSPVPRLSARLALAKQCAQETKIALPLPPATTAAAESAGWARPAARPISAALASAPTGFVARARAMASAVTALCPPRLVVVWRCRPARLILVTPLGNVILRKLASMVAWPLVAETACVMAREVVSSTLRGRFAKQAHAAPPPTPHRHPAPATATARA